MFGAEAKFRRVLIKGMQMKRENRLMTGKGL
jgi:hypothetical protein